MKISLFSPGLSGRCRRIVRAGSGCVLVASLCTSILADSDEVGCPGPIESESLIRPVKVVSISGNVQDAEALVDDHQGNTTLSWNGVGSAPTIVLDYGRDVGGLPVFDVIAVSGTPKLRAIYSEAQPYLLPNGDAAAPGEVENPIVAQPEVTFVGDAGAGDLSRVDTYPVSRPGLIINRLIQGGERFQALTLDAPGSVSLRWVGIRSKTFQARSTRNRGSFACSDSALNEIWALGAHTVRLNQVPAYSLRPTWTPSLEGVEVPGNEFSVYQGGITWTDYTAAFQVQVLSNEAAWLVRATSSDGLHFVLASDKDVLGMGKPNTLRAYAQFNKSPLGEATLPFDLKPGSWHTVKTVVAGTDASVYLDGQSVLSFNFKGVPGFAGAIAAGSVGFGNQQGAEARFRNLSVTSSGGLTLYSSALSGAAVLDDFAVGINHLPTIMDGAKRDRFVWSGDIGISGLTILYDSGAAEYIAGSVRLHGDYATSSGEAAGFLPPQLIPRSKTTDNNFSGYTFDPDYSIYFVTSLYNYYLYTGNLKFVNEEWPTVKNEMNYLAGLVDPTNHVIPGGFGPDKDTASNAHYYAALSEAAQLAVALGEADTAAGFSARAAALKAAINGYLFNARTQLYDVSDTQRGVADQLGNAKAVLYGVAPSSQRASILQNLRTALYRTPSATNATGPIPVQQSSGSTQVGPFTSGFELWARFEAGDTAVGLALIRNEWGLMRKSSPYYTGGTWEYVALDGTPGLGTGTNLSHGWASAPTPALSKYVLGVRPIEAGFKSWLIEPQPGDLAWAAGTVPTPYGAISVAWNRGAKAFHLVISVPAGTMGTVGVPVTSAGTLLSDNGRTVTRGKHLESDQRAIGLRLPAGPWTWDACYSGQGNREISDARMIF